MAPSLGRDVPACDDDAYGCLPGRTYVADRLGATRGRTATRYRVGADESIHHNDGWLVPVADPAVDLLNFRSECHLGTAAPASSSGLV